jgi:hypothetical protein
MLTEDIQPNPIESRSTELRPLHRGIWADRLTDGQKLPVGGHVFGQEMTTMLELDFKSFESELGNFNRKKIDALFAKYQEEVRQQLKDAKANIDPYLFFILCHVQTTMDQLLASEQKENFDQAGREKLYQDQSIPKLSQFKGKAACAERAALGQYLLQKLGIESSYVSGLTMRDPKDEEELPEDHSYLVLPDLKDPDTTYIFDIARPNPQHNLPRLLKTSQPFIYNLIAGKKGYLVKTADNLDDLTLWFGVGEPAFGYFKTKK